MTDDRRQRGAWQPLRGFDLNTRRPAVTWGFLIACAVIYVLDMGLGWWFTGGSLAKLPSWLMGDSGVGVLSLFGMRINEYITAGQWWRLVTPIFLHGSLSHLGLNCLALYLWGRYAEALFGRARYAAIFLLAGIGGTVLGYAFSTANSLGASGAIFGIFGALLAFRKYDKQLFNFIFGAQVVVFIVLSLMMGFFQSSIDVFGHMGGLVCGYLAARTVGMPAARRLAPGRVLCGLLLVIFIGGGIAIGYLT